MAAAAVVTGGLALIVPRAVIESAVVSPVSNRPADRPPIAARREAGGAAPLTPLPFSPVSVAPLAIELDQASEELDELEREIGNLASDLVEHGIMADPAPFEARLVRLKGQRRRLERLLVLLELSKSRVDEVAAAHRIDDDGIGERFKPLSQGEER
jgi:hypothetical protein